LDDQPDLESGIMFCAGADPARALDPNEELPAYYVERFYGRETVPIPKYIPLDDDAQQPLFP
jgi:hypothetical protein